MPRSLVILAYPKIDHERDYVYSWMPFSILAIAKILLGNNLAEIVIFDGNQSTPEEWDKLLKERIGDTLCIGISIMTGGGQIGHALNLARLAKRYEHCPPIVYGGPHVNVLAAETLQHPLVDAVLTGPGQNSMPAYVEALLGRRAMNSVPGLMLKSGLSGPTNPPRTQALGRYPWHLLDVEQYIRNDPTVAQRTLNYVASQGCVYECQFCYELTYKRKYSAIQAPDLLEDVTELKERYDLSGLKFYDADWLIDIRRAKIFCQGVIDRGLELRWAASVNPNDILKARERQPDLLGLMANSGCTRLLMGVESGSDRVLSEIVKKGVTRAQTADVAHEIARNGILGSYTFIVGFPGETIEEQEATYSLLDELRTLVPQPETRVHLFAPYPGTPLYKEALRLGFRPPSTLENWSHYDYYTSLTPWTDEGMARRARTNTNLSLTPVAKRTLFLTKWYNNKALS